jgi:hypothetical protein
MDIFRVYTEYKRRIIFLIMMTCCLSEEISADFSPSARSFLNTIKFVMVDEYQDTINCRQI